MITETLVLNYHIKHANDHQIALGFCNFCPRCTKTYIEVIFKNKAKLFKRNNFLQESNLICVLCQLRFSIWFCIFEYIKCINRNSTILTTMLLIRPGYLFCVGCNLLSDVLIDWYILGRHGEKRQLEVEELYNPRDWWEFVCWVEFLFPFYVPSLVDIIIVLRLCNASFCLVWLFSLAASSCENWYVGSLV